MNTTHPAYNCTWEYEYYKADSLALFAGQTMRYWNGYKWKTDIVEYERGYYWLGNYKATTVLIESY